MDNIVRYFRDVYACSQQPMVEAIGMALEPWVMFASTSIFKDLYDLVWAAAGGVPDDAYYKSALVVLGGVVTERVDPQGAVFFTVDFDPQRLATLTPGYLEFWPIQPPCIIWASV